MPLTRSERFARDGFVIVEGLLRPDEIEWYRHYSRGNSTTRRRRALIVNFRPRAMVEIERARGFDHGKDAPGRENRNPLTR